MAAHIRVEVKAKDSFWYQAFQVEWQDRYPERLLQADGAGFLVDSDWLSDLQEIGEQVFCQIVLSPQNPQRRAWFSALLPPRK